MSSKDSKIKADMKFDKKNKIKEGSKKDLKLDKKKGKTSKYGKN